MAPADLAVSQSDLQDLALTSSDGRPVPFSVAPDHTELQLAVSSPNGDRHRSEYCVALPVAPLQIEALTFKIPVAAEAFNRPFVLEAEVEGKPFELSAGRLFRRKGTAIPLSFAIDPVPLTQLRLRVENGEEGPLRIETISARVSTFSLQLTAPAGDYLLWLGGPSGRVPPKVEALRAGAVEAQRGELETNPLYLAREAQRRLSAAHWMVGGLSIAVLAVWAAARRVGDRV